MHKARSSLSAEAYGDTQVHVWERMRLPVPYAAMEIQAQREKYRILSEKMLTVVHEYNNIITSVADARKLFTDRLKHLDQRINSGVNKLVWTMDKVSLDFFLKEARKHCRDGTNSVATFKQGLACISALCSRVADLCLIDLKRKQVAHLTDFADAQRLHHLAVTSTVAAISADIQNTKTQLYHIFATDSVEVQQQWLGFTEKLDKDMFNALRVSVKKSLGELSKAINGDARTEIVPLFYTALELEKSLGASETVELVPTLQDLANLLRSVARELLQVCHPFVAC
jgi:dynein heavy chain, axonemal